MIKRKLYPQLLLLIHLIMNNAVDSLAQTYPIEANTVLIPPHSLSISDYQLEKSQDLLINLTLNDPVEPYWDVSFKITLSNGGTDILQTSPGYQSQPYRLNQFSTVTITGFEIADYLSFDNLVPLNGYTYTGKLPEGLNSICIEVVDYNRPDVSLSRRACGTGYAILNDPPYPQLPLCGEDLGFQEAQNIMFTWLPMHLGSPNPVSGIEYEFSLVRVEDGYNQYEAIEAASPLYKESTPNTSLILQDPILEPGYTYAWRVRVVDSFDGGAVNAFKNDGYSIVCSFDYQKTETADLSELYANDGTSECGASCQAELPSNSEIITDMGVGDVVQIGKFFMNITEISSASGGFYAGKGYVFIPFLLSNMNVAFTDMTVNTDGIMFSGDVATDIDSDLLDDNFSSTDGQMTIDANEISQINQFVESQGRQTNQMEFGSSLGLPIALDNTIGGVTSNLIITGISFETDIAYLNAVMSFGSASVGDLIAFGGKGICFHPYGIGGGSAQLFLNEDFSLGDYSEIDLTFKAPGIDNVGTYVTFDCTGFQELNIDAEYEFPTDVLVNADGSGNPVVATMSIASSEWGQFMAGVEFDDFEVYGVDGYVFSINEAYIDYSDVANAENAQFPEGYEGTGEGWKGFYLSALTMTLPENLAQSSGDLSVGVQNVIIDHSGVSANIFAAGVLDIESGRMGEWAFSLDTIQVNIVSNSLVDGSLLGQIHVPILDEDNALAYSALMSKTNEGIDLLFNIQTEEDVNVGMWAAELSLSSSSVIAIEKTSDGFTPYAELHGDMTLDIEFQEGNAFTVEAMSFEGLKINHPDEDQRIAVDAFSLFGGGSGLDDDSEEEVETEDDEEQESLSGFPVSISNVAFEEGDGNEAGINFDLNINLTGDDLGVGGTTNLTVTGEYDVAGAPFNTWSFSGVELSSIEVDADLAAGSIQGSIDIYKGDDTYGTGFKGLLNAKFTGIGQVDAMAQFGKVDGFRYFFVDAMVLSQSPFVDILGIGLYGFGGGIYHHMSRDDTDPALNLEAGSLYAEPSELGASLSGIVYTPNEATLIGLKAALTMGIAPGTTFSADAYFEASFGLSNGAPSIRSIAFGGKGYFMSPGTILDREESQVIGQFDANLDLSDLEDPIFTATAQITFDTDVISGSGNAALKLSNDESYVWIGTPDNRVIVSVGDFTDVGIYADMGDKVPDMPKPEDVLEGYNGTTPEFSLSYAAGTNIMFGGYMAIPEKSYNYGSFYANANFTLGFDAYMGKVTSNCDLANGTIGIDGWYLKANAYAEATANLGLNVDVWFYSGNVSILDFYGYMLLKAELPNPTWLSGEVYAEYSVLSGAVKGSVNFDFEIGDQCETFDVKEVNLSGLEVISDTNPSDGETSVSVLENPAIAFNFPLEESMDFEVVDENGNTSTKYFRPVINSIQLTGGTANYEVEYAEDGLSVILRLIEMLDANKEYTLKASVKWQEKISGSWSDISGSIEYKTIAYKTGARPTVLEADFIEFTKPFENQRNAYHYDITSLQIWARTESWAYLTQAKGYDYYLQLRCVDDDETKGYYPLYSWRTTTKNGYTGWYVDDNMLRENYFPSHKGHVHEVTLCGFPEDIDPWEQDESYTSTTSSTTGTHGDGTLTTTSNQLSGATSGYVELYQYFFRASDYYSRYDKLRDMEYESTEMHRYEVPYTNGYVTDGKYTHWTNWYMDTRYYQHSRWKLGNSYEAFDDIDRNGFSSSTGLLETPPLLAPAYMESWDNSESTLLSDHLSTWNVLIAKYNYYYSYLSNYTNYFTSSTSQNYWNYLKKLDDNIFDQDYPRFAAGDNLEVWYHYKNKSYLDDSEKASGGAWTGMNAWYSHSQSVAFRSRGEWILNAIESTLYNVIWKTVGVRFNDGYKGTYEATGTFENSSFFMYPNGETWTWEFKAD